MTAEPVTQTYHVFMDVNRWDRDEGRAWITVQAASPQKAKQQVREMYPDAAVLMAETDDGVAA